MTIAGDGTGEILFVGGFDELMDELIDASGGERVSDTESFLRSHRAEPRGQGGAETGDDGSRASCGESGRPG